MREEARRDPKKWLSKAEFALHQHDQEARFRLRHHATYFLLWAYGLALLNTFVIIYLQGSHVRGFQLEPGFFRWLGVATLGEIGGLLVFVYKAIFR